MRCTRARVPAAACRQRTSVARPSIAPLSISVVRSVAPRSAASIATFSAPAAVSAPAAAAAAAVPAAFSRKSQTSLSQDESARSGLGRTTARKQNNNAHHTQLDVSAMKLGVANVETGNLAGMISLMAGFLSWLLMLGENIFETLVYSNFPQMVTALDHVHEFSRRPISDSEGT